MMATLYIGFSPSLEMPEVSHHRRRRGVKIRSRGGKNLEREGRKTDADGMESSGIRCHDATHGGRLAAPTFPKPLTERSIS
jgi:hypothetical protein